MDKPSITRRDALRGIGGAGVAGTLLSAIGGVSAQDDEYVSKKTARTIAKNAVRYLGARSEFKEWRTQGVKVPQLYYTKVRDGNSVEYVPRAWVFAIEDRGDDVGYITIDADQIDTPVLAYGKSKAPHKRIEGAKKVAKGHGASVNNRFLYHSGVEFGIETTDRKMVDLRGGKIKKLPAVANANNLKPTVNVNGKDTQSDQDDGVTTQKEKDNAPDWDGDTDESISNVPNWTEHDDGGASSTDYGTGADSWDSWDGCIPIAGSMAIGYHEDISEYDDEEREALIDRLHDDMNTDNGGSTTWLDVDNGISNYDEGDHSYNGNNNRFNIKGNIKDAVAANEPPILNMTDGPYTQDDEYFNGHSVTVVGYRSGSDYFYHKVHNGYGEAPDRVSNGNWTDVSVTRISKS